MKHEVDRIKEIIDRFYRGEATPEEIELAVDYFKTTSELDESLSVDRDIFIAMSELPSETQIPVELEEKILDATIYSHGKPRILPWIVSAISAAAVVALIYIANPISDGNGGGVDFNSTIAATVTNNDTLSIPEESMDPEPTAIKETSAPAIETPVEQTVIVSRKAVKAKKRATKLRKQQAKSPEQPSTKERSAAKLSIELINRTLSKANIACANAEESFMKIEQTLNE